MGGAENPFLFGAVAGLEEDALGGFVAAALLPDFGWLQGGHENLQGAGAVHFLAHDLLDLAQGAQGRAAGRYKGRPVSLRIKAGAQEELVRERFQPPPEFLSEWE